MVADASGRWVFFLAAYGIPSYQVSSFSMRLRPFNHIENSLEFIVERPFSMLFRRSVQPAEIGKRLKRELTSGTVVTIRGKMAPNDFTVVLNPEDFQPYQDHGRVLSDDLSGWLEEVALASNLATIGAIRVRFLTEDSIRQGRFEVKSAVLEAETIQVPYVDPGQTEAFEVVQRRGAEPTGFIEICSGPSLGAVFPVRKQIVTIGRDLSNDLVIESAEVSRFHAELHTYDRSIFIEDRNSMNGTFVNGHQVIGSQSIDTGDQVMFGTTICRYWRELL